MFYYFFDSKNKTMVKIESISFGEIKIDDKIYYSDVVIFWDGKIDYREKSHLFDMDEFLKLKEKGPEIIVVGTGISGCVKIPERVKEVATELGVRIFYDTSDKAKDIFNAFLSQGKKVIGVFHTTC